MTGRKQPFGLGLDLRPRRGRPGSRRRPPLAGWEALTHPRRNPAATLASASAHAAILLLAWLSPRFERQQSSPPTQRPPTPRLVYLMPREVPSKPKPPVEPRRLPPPPRTPAFEAADRQVPELPSPSSAAAPTPEHDEPAATTPEVKGETEDPMVTEARRLFGPPARSGLPVNHASGGTRCPWSGKQVERVDRSSTGVIEGIVRTHSGGRAIPGAFLQLLGSGHATFADGAGRYRLTFDPTLVGVCRSQLVRVTAPGFRARTMVLAYGSQSTNVVDLEARR